MPGLSASGFEILRLADIRAAIRDAIAAAPALGPEVQTGADTAIGQVIDIVADREAALWELALALYNALEADAAGAR